MSVTELKELILQFEKEMADFYRKSGYTHNLDYGGVNWSSFFDSFRSSGKKRIENQKYLLNELEKLKNQLDEKEYLGLKLRIKTAYEN